jgi:TP53 regulating kinase-like protein
LKIINEGAEAKIYGGRFLGTDVVIKDRIQKRYRIKELDDSIRAQRTKNEARALYAASSHGLNVPNVLLVEGTNLYIRKIAGTSLHEYINGRLKMPGAMLGRAAHDAGTACGILHNLDISHGDYTPANMMIDRKGELWIIDFGLAERTRSAEEKALDLLLMKRAVSAKLFESFLKGYRKSCTSHAEIINRLMEIEQRGRYQTRTLVTA